MYILERWSHQIDRKEELQIKDCRENFSKKGGEKKKKEKRKKILPWQTNTSEAAQWADFSHLHSWKCEVWVWDYRFVAKRCQNRLSNSSSFWSFDEPCDVQWPANGRWSIQAQHLFQPPSSNSRWKWSQCTTLILWRIKYQMVWGLDRLGRILVNVSPPIELNAPTVALSGDMQYVW